MSPHAVTVPEALRALQTMIGWAGGWIPVRWARNGLSGLVYTETPEALQHLVEEMDEVQIGLPERFRFCGVHGATVLWAIVEGNAQLAAARKFRPLPSLVLAEGASSKRLMLWSLRSRANYFDIQDANRKIAYRLRAVQKHGDPESLWIPCPGSQITGKRAKPVAVRVARLSTDDYTVEEITGRLKAPPDVKWYDRAA